MLAKNELNSVEVLISKALISSKINLAEFFSKNNVLKQNYDMKEGIKNL